ncbi:nephrin [Neopsephotus bourkii]|uniref:nephrin n=1 Tax=Neopsephotus bourkii TaxID=309878 RepID=UPI002AA5698E|nr:nephrin [Neopsephotus bourkii]
MAGKWGLMGEALLALLVAGVTASATPFVEEPTNGSVVLGGEAELRCVVRGGVVAQWARDGLLLGAPPTAAHPRYRLAGDPQRGQYHLRIKGVELEDDAAFECQAGGGNGTGPPRASRSARLRVMVPPGPPALELPPGEELPWVGGAEVHVSCHAHDARPAPRLVLTLGGVPLPEASSRVFEGSHPKLSSAEVTVRLTPQRQHHGQRLLCAASNEAGAAPTEAALTLDVLFPPGPPTIEGLDSPHVRAGDKLELVCIVRGGNPPPSLHWDKDGRPLAAPWVTQRPLAVTRSPLAVAVTRGDDGATLRCRVQTQRPLAAGGSASVTLHVTYPPSEVTLSGPRGGAENESLTLTCASGPSNPPARLHWWLGGRQLRPSESSTAPAPGGGTVTSSNLTLVARRSEHGRPLVCEAAAAGVGVARASLVLSITHPPDSLWIEAPPPNASFRVGALVRLGCYARGGHPPPRLVWSKEGRALQEPLPGWGRDLELKLSPGDNGAAFTCGDTAHQQGAPRASTRLRVLFPPQSVSISASPREPRLGQRLQLTCVTGSSHPAPTLTWHLHGRTEPGEPLPPSPAPHGGVSVASRLRLQVALQDQGHVITCAAASPALGVTVRAGHRLSVRHPPLLRSPPGGRVLALENSGAVLPLLGDAHPPLRECAWSRDGARLAPSPRHRLLPGGSLAIGNLSRSDAGLYRVQCGNAEGKGSASVRLDVHYPPSIVRAPDPVVVDEGGTIEMECEAEGRPLLDGSLRWQRLGALSPGPMGLPMGLEALGGVPVGRLRVSGARRDMGGAYECHVDTGIPPPARAVIRLLIRYGPELEAVPEPEPIPVLVPDGADAVALGCRARGVPPVELHWVQGGRPISTMDSRFQQLQWSDPPWTRGLLTVANISQDRARLRSQSRHLAPSQYLNWEQGWDGNGTLGMLECVARNELGTVRRRFRLRLADRPDPPHSLRVSGATPSSLRISWSPGFNGGSAQSFLISARVPGAPPPPSYVITSASSHTLTGLRPATPYDVTVRARNARGDSAPTVIRGITSELPRDWPEEGAGPTAPPAALPPPTWPLAALACSALAAILGGALWCCRRRHFREAVPEVTAQKGSEVGTSNDYGPEPEVGALDQWEAEEEWGGYEEVLPPAPRVTPEGELV